METICHKTFDVIDAVVKDRTITSHEWALFCRNDLAMQRVLAKFSLAGKLQVSRSEAKDGGDSSPEASPRRRVDSGQVARRKSTLTQHPGLIPVWKSTSGMDASSKTSNLSISVKSKSIRLIFGRIDRSRRVLEAQPKSLHRNCRIRAH